MTNEYNSRIITKFMKNISVVEQKRTDAKMIMAAKIYDVMASKGISLEDIEKIMGVDVNELLSGTYNFTIEELSDISHILGVELIIKSF
jgi:(p)ppGpp synthase/HD superfamily hydrolase